ncbi:hypothetical protein GCM10010912_45860 [Paenibacillus albidus]|uniref:HTH araC/xylS-type domain-containing protein n=1 Tax=Paenibacillus albidus TaxID=2041023 RepID=A0A917CTP1_9BACL|nr:AraC family transcriptional regulator [Paenibacillus albidus]GGF95736.1 hypothetical protein GCM10010912_45860 [Paenibacillus albidus]
MTAKHSTNYVLHASSNRFYWEGNGQLSIKTFSGGQARYKAKNGWFAVEEDRYLLLNEGPYTLEIDEHSALESFCLFFKNGFAGEILRSLTESTDVMLTDPFKERESLGFFEQTYPTTRRLSSQITAFKANLTTLAHDPLGYEEHFHRIMHTILFGQLDTLREVDTLPSIRRSTREELYRRVSTAHEYIRAYYHQPLQLKDIAQIACLSPNHLLRTYAQLYGTTPHQHISEYRIRKAKLLLDRLDYSITDISFDLGFGSPVSFSKIFRQHVGVSPLQYRKLVIMDKK